MTSVPSEKLSEGLAVTSQEKASEDEVRSTEEANSSLTPELVFVLCGPIGSPIHETAKQLASLLTSDFDYIAEIVRLSEMIRLNASLVGTETKTENRFDTVKSLIDAGNKLREKFDSDILAKLAIAKIGGDRQKRFGEFGDKVAEKGAPAGQRVVDHRICHIIDSIKNKHELELLRLIYGESLFAIGVFAPLEIRRMNLLRDGMSEKEIDKLVDRDSGEEIEYGQSVRDTFPKCDVFLRVDYAVGGHTEDKAVGQMVEKVRRFLNLVFRTHVVTPTSDENAMYAAASAARNSACLSRQVGAAATSRAGEILAVGWNDVPRSGGGLYGKPPLFVLRKESDSFRVHGDDRCFGLPGARCFNDEEKRAIAEKLVDALVSAGFVATGNRSAAVDAVIDDSRVKDLIEFSRAVHAEMHALLGASRVAGERIVNGKLFVTTYPCHSCARHLVAAGITEVVYIEPYRKSLATRLHGDALTESVDETRKVRILQFDGVAPRRFIDLFEHANRKAKGVLRLPSKSDARPATHTSLKAIPRLEEVVVAEVEQKKLNLPRLIEVTN